MTSRTVLLLFLAACAPKREANTDLPKARAKLDQLMVAGDGPVIEPPSARDAILAHADKLVACVPNRSDVGVLVEGGQAIAFDRGLLRDPVMEACITSALPPLPGRVIFVPGRLPGAKPQVLRIDASTTEAALEGLDPKIEVSVLVMKDAAPDNVTRLVEKLRDRGFTRLVVRVVE